MIGGVFLGDLGMTTMLTNLLISSVLWMGLHGCAAASPVKQEPATSPATQPSTPAANEPIALPDPPATSPTTRPWLLATDSPVLLPDPLDPAIDALLTKLETSAPDLTSFTATIGYDKDEFILDRQERRTGELIYRVDAATKEKAFAVLFDSTIVNGVKRKALKHYIFNGRWLVEVDHERKQFIKREIVAPGQTLDPLKLGEGPFPLPLGQPKSEVLARFDVELISLPADGLLKDLKNVDGIRLKPRAGTKEAEDYTSVDLFYDRETLLPAGIIARQTNEDVKTVRLKDLKRNPKLGDSQLKKLDITEPDPRQWRIDVQPWKAAD